MDFSILKYIGSHNDVGSPRLQKFSRILRVDSATYLQPSGKGFQCQKRLLLCFFVKRAVRII